MQKIILADHSELDRTIIYEIFASQYELVTTDSSEELFRLLLENKEDTAIALVSREIGERLTKEAVHTLLNLKVFDYIPFLVILDEGSGTAAVQKLRFSYSDVIYSPINPFIVKRRAANLIEGFANKKELHQLIDDQTRKILEQNRTLKEQQKKINTINNDMLDTLSMVIEYRDVESGRHIHRIRKFTEVLLRILAEKYPKYNLDEDKIELITSASSIHDIGKIAIPDSVLLSPRRLSYEEFKVMKQHTVKGCEILDQMDAGERNEYFRYCYDICRYHHEKWDGTGYPDGLVGDQIPIWAQVVSLADCYDALTSDRPYKSAYSHEQAVEMIRTGACGAFSEEMMDCFGAALPKFRELAIEYADVNNADRNVSDDHSARKNSRTKKDDKKSIYMKMDRRDLIETVEHQKDVIANMYKQDRNVLYKSADYVFEFDIANDMLHERKGSMKDVCGYVPKNYEETVNILSEACEDDYRSLFARTFRMKNVSDAAGDGEEKIVMECRLDMGGSERTLMNCTVVPLAEDGKLRTLFILLTAPPSGEEHYGSDRDVVTGLWNYAGAKREIDDYFENEGKNGYHALMLIDIDDFRNINRQAGYRFGNDILCEVTKLLRYQTADNHILGRIEDDNFVVLINDCPEREERDALVEEILRCIGRTYITGDERSLSITSSVGIALYPDDGTDFETLFGNASRAVEVAKLNGKNIYLYYNRSMRDNWELKRYDSDLSVRENSAIEPVDYREFFIPVCDSETGHIMSYDVLGLSGEYMDEMNSVDGMLDAIHQTENFTALSLNNTDHLLSCIYGLEKEKIALPGLSILTMFDGKDTAAVLTAFEEMLQQYPVSRNNICILLSHEMLEQLDVSELSEFTSQLKSFGFRVGVYNVGTGSINLNCFIDGLFDRVVFARSFIDAIKDGVYPTDIITSMMTYFDKMGTRSILPCGIGTDFVKGLKYQARQTFGYHKDEMISLSDFRQQMKSSSEVRLPVLEHAHTSLVLNEKVYDEILEQTRSFILEWSPRFDKIKLSGSFENMYGYSPADDNFLRDITYSEFIHNDDKKKFIEKLNAARIGHSEAEAFIRVFSRGENDYLWNRVHFVTIRNSSDIPTKIMAVFTDISDSRSDPIDERRRGRTDFITNLYNKHAVENKIKSYLYDEGASGTHAFLIAEICGFEVLERELGTVFANAVLKEAAQNIRELFRDSDIIGRSSGSRFSVFVKGMNMRDKIREKADDICRIINNKYQSENGEITVFGKVGVSMFTADGTTYDELYSAALKALYFAKHNIRVNTAFASDTDEPPKLLHE